VERKTNYSQHISEVLKELVERPGDTAVQGRIGVTENDPDRAPELFQLGGHLYARADRGQ
jgi:hypothetical protein